MTTRDRQPDPMAPGDGADAPATPDAPATLQVLRYDPDRHTLTVIVGGPGRTMSRAALVKHANEAIRTSSFICHTAKDATRGEADEVCFVPREGHCEIVGIHTNGWHRHHGDHRRSLVEILNEIAAAVARGTLSFLDDAELAAELDRGEEILVATIDDSSSLAHARSAVAMVLERHGVGEETRGRMQLCVSEATTNMLVHGGGGGCMRLRLLDDRLRAIVADRGPGLNFLNWIGPGGDQPSMGYGYKIILDNLEQVYLHTGGEGTTLILDRSLQSGETHAAHAR